ncbi:MAG TPA: hypothetical protein VN317_06265 [Candidatus Methanoperedens sp.]|nr:hypothetical protein [Candidatus Methanoperedens sp.]
MKKIASGLAALLLLLQFGSAFAQTSDYEVIESFKKRNQALLTSLKAAQNAQQVTALESDIARLQAEYAPHKALLGEGLYPATLEKALTALRDQAQEARERVRKAEESRQDKAKIVEITRRSEEDTKTIARISQENTEFQASIARLSAEVKDLGARIEQLTTENTGLQGQIKTLQAQGKKDRETIAKLKELTEKLNANIRDRDALIVKMMDSMFGEYGKADLTDAQKRDLFTNVQGSDYVGKIVSTLDGNVKYSENALFSAQDLKLIREEQLKLSTKWDSIKPFVAKLYPDEQSRVRDIATVDGRVADWKRSINETTWKSIHQAFAGAKVDVGPFQTAAEFHTRLLAYLDEQVRTPSREKHRAFRQVWDSPIKDQWLPLIPTDELTSQQRGEIDERITRWDEAISAMLRRWVMLGALGVVLLAAILVLLRRKKKPATAGR